MRLGIVVLMLSCAIPALGQDAACGSLGKPFLRTTLFFGMNRKSGHVTEGQWKAFVRSDVTPRFTKGFTVLPAAGVWRRSDGINEHERTKVLLVIHEETVSVLADVQAIIDSYKKKFEQEAVLWETEHVCAKF